MLDVFLLHLNINPGMFGSGASIITISDALDVYVLSLLPSVPAVYAGLFLLKLIKQPRKESTRALGASIGVGILLSSFYDLIKETAGISTGTLRNLTDVFNVIVLSAVLLSFIGISHASKKRSGDGNNDNNPTDTKSEASTINGANKLRTTMTAIAVPLVYSWAALGVGLHSVGEGIIMGYDFSTSATSMSPAQTSSFVLHKIGEGFTIGVLIMFSRGVGGDSNNNSNNTSSSKRYTLHTLAIGAIAAVPTVAGAAMGYALFPSTLSTYFFAASAGATIFIITRLAYLAANIRQHGSLVIIGILIGFLFFYFSGILHQFE